MLIANPFFCIVDIRIAFVLEIKAEALHCGCDHASLRKRYCRNQARVVSLWRFGTLDCEFVETLVCIISEAQSALACCRALPGT